MPSILNTVSALVAFSGAALASYNTTGSYNSTASAGINGTTYHHHSNGSNFGVDQAICDRYDGKHHMPLYSDVNGRVLGFSINCNQGPKAGTGTKIVVEIARRADVLTLDSCIKECEAITGCVATAFNRDTSICSFYAGDYVLGADNGVDFAAVVSNSTAAADNGNGDGGASSTITATIQSTQVHTVYQCASTVTDCPYRSYVTDVIDITTTYCPGNTGAAATATSAGAVATNTGAPIVCPTCAYSSALYTGYTSSVNGAGSTSYVAVTTVVVNVAIMTSGVASTTVATVASTGLFATTTSSIVPFTGAAGHVEAGMGLAAIVGAAALLI